MDPLKIAPFPVVKKELICNRNSTSNVHNSAGVLSPLTLNGFLLTFPSREGQSNGSKVALKGRAEN